MIGAIRSQINLANRNHPNTNEFSFFAATCEARERSNKIQTFAVNYSDL